MAKEFDIFLEGHMPKEFDVFLKEHMTEYDLFVYSIPYYDFLSISDCVVLDTTLSKHVLEKLAKVHIKSDLASHIIEITKLFPEKFGSSIEPNTTLNNSAKKFVAAESAITNLQEVNETLIKIACPNNDGVVVVNTDLKTCLKKYRMLKEVDDLPVSEMDNMTLEELDYVWVTA